jgi:spore coat polysaccharide biosynthesis protein SpsF
MSILLRRATQNDCKTLWGWRNDEATRRSAFDSDRVEYADHVAWFKKKLIDKNSIIFICEDGQDVIGEMRLDRVGNIAEVDVCVDPIFRGKGLGAEILIKGSKVAFQKLSVDELIAHIKKDNKTSLRAFEKAGFVKIGIKNIKGQECMELSLRRNAYA